MKQIQEQTLTQQQVQRQNLKAQQVLFVRMLEMPLAQLEENIRMEVDVNPSLESVAPDAAEYQGGDDAQIDGPMDGNDNPGTEEQSNEENDRADELNQALDNMGADDRMDGASSDDYRERSQMMIAEESNIEDAENTSFLDTLYEQMNMEDLSEKEVSIMQYLIGSLDDDGLLRKDIISIIDELTIYHYMDVTEEEVMKVLKVLQTFEPTGVGAQSLQECLLLQVRSKEPSELNMLMDEILTKYYDDFINNRMNAIQQRMHLDDYQIERVKAEIKRLNPKPGASFGEIEGRSLQQITPDFIVSIDYDGNITYEINHGRMPEISVVKEDEMFLKDYSGKTGLTKGEKEAIDFTRKNVNKANMYVGALKLRNHTLDLTMKTIIDVQRKFFLDGDEADLKPMLLKDVAKRTGLDLSTISRARRAKYVQTPWGMFPLSYFFSESYDTGGGTALSTKSVKAKLQEVIDHEDPKHPYSDEKLCTMLSAQGIPIARRTIAKYREQLNIPSARLRKR